MNYILRIVLYELNCCQLKVHYQILTDSQDHLNPEGRRADTWVRGFKMKLPRLHWDSQRAWIYTMFVCIIWNKLPHLPLCYKSGSKFEDWISSFRICFLHNLPSLKVNGDFHWIIGDCAVSYSWFLLMTTWGTSGKKYCPSLRYFSFSYEQETAVCTFSLCSYTHCVDRFGELLPVSHNCWPQVSQQGVLHQDSCRCIWTAIIITIAYDYTLC